MLFPQVALVCLVLSGVALGQAIAPTDDPAHNRATKTPAAANPLDGSEPITQAQASALLEEMRRLELLLSARAASPDTRNATADGGKDDANVPVTLPLRAADHTLGSPSAPIVIVEFADFQCPFCKDFQEATFPTLEKDYIKTGRVRLVVRDLPLGIHPYARPAAEAARCAGEQGKYWELRNALLTLPGPPTAEKISSSAAEAHLEMQQFGQCQGQHKFSADIDAEEGDAERLNINGTPSFLIGRLLNGKVQGIVIKGNRPIDVYRHEIQRLLSEEKDGPGSAAPSGSPIHTTRD